jgi:hypothetical protein
MSVIVFTSIGIASSCGKVPTRNSTNLVCQFSFAFRSCDGLHLEIHKCWRISQKKPATPDFVIVESATKLEAIPDSGSSSLQRNAGACLGEQDCFKCTRRFDSAMMSHYGFNRFGWSWILHWKLSTPLTFRSFSARAGLLRDWSMIGSLSINRGSVADPSSNLDPHVNTQRSP